MTSDAAGVYWAELCEVLGEPWYEPLDVILLEAVNGDMSGSVTHTVGSVPVNQVDIVLEGGGPQPFDMVITLTVTDDDGLTATVEHTVTLVP